MQKKYKKFNIIHPFLFSLFPVLFIYSQNIREISVQEIILPVLLILFAAVLLWLLARFIIKNNEKSGLIISLLLVFSNSVLADPKMDLGLDVYNNKAQCGVCHTLQAAGSKGLIGPNLDQLKPQIPQIIFAVTNGIGVMQSWEGILTYEEIEAVAYYVFNSTK